MTKKIKTEGNNPVNGQQIDTNAETSVEAPTIIKDENADPGDAIVDKDAAMDGNKAEPDTQETETLNEGVTDAEQSISEPGLPPNVTLEPQHPEHLDLNSIPDPIRFAQIYIPISDDDGSKHGKPDLESQVIKVIEDNRSINPGTLTDPEAFLTGLRNLNQQYLGTVDLCEAIETGTVAKYRIRQGSLFNIEKIIIKSQKKSWEEYYNQNYEFKRFRSVQMWMQIANVPNSIRYAAFGIERLLELVRAVKHYGAEVKDPIGEFLKEHRLPVDLENVGPDEEFKIEVDTALAAGRIAKEFAANQVEVKIDPALIKSWIKAGNEVSQALIGQMIIAAKRGHNPNDLIDEEKRKDEAIVTTLTAEKTVLGFPKLVSEMKSTVEFLSRNMDLKGRIKGDDIQVLEAIIVTLKQWYAEN